MLFQERILKIMSLIEEKGTVKNADLIKILKISEATIRRDLDYLEKKKKIIRVRGGAILNRAITKVVTEELSIDVKEDMELESKKEIAKIASSYRIFKG